MGYAFRLGAGFVAEAEREAGGAVEEVCEEDEGGRGGGEVQEEEGGDGGGAAGVAGVGAVRGVGC